jgi:D-alanyl-D-alanine carboxypeptidase
MTTRPFHSAWLLGEGPAAANGAASGRFPWWSFTKTVLAICVLRLAEAGRLQLDARQPGKAFTLRQLLLHRAGVPNYTKLEAYQGAVARDEDAWSRERLLQAAGADRLVFPPGEGWAYSNIGYLFVRDAIEDAACAPLADALRELVLAPAGLGSVRLATGREDFRDVFWPGLRTYDPGWVYHGCLVGAPAEAAQMLHAVFAGELLTSSSLAAMFERSTSLSADSRAGPWTECGYALGLMTGRMGSAGRALGHSGVGPGSVNAVYHFPDLARPVTVATFTDGEDDGVAEAQALFIAMRAQQ